MNPPTDAADEDASTPISINLQPARQAVEEARLKILKTALTVEQLGSDAAELPQTPAATETETKP